ncbi:uncharacterized protein BCR38DRAFT_411103 [Pseudomassariella vexata]|uniref:DUF7820 domain-containing protein n=1 Tax=Pseudomassariella vexata TaxID=1141098 RepID=A0A1Y2DPK1_9PEZI|nr:uncharacterized protein BCR38DRAFT_411103 [Pseudomassariella vexata]ORY61213.1 hypothetical protein BCR38DRAFT_411103 [Pseudomassariella vexata]
MSGTDSKAADPDQRASMRTSMRLSRLEGDDEDYDLQAMGISDGFRPADMGVSDGFRPTQMGVSDGFRPMQMGVSDGFRPTQMGVSDGFRPTQMGVSDGFRPTQMGVSDGFRPTQMGVSDGFRSTQVGISDGFRPTPMGPSDGFRPADVAQDHANPSSPSNPEPPAAQVAQPLSARPSSIGKPPHRPRESFTLRHDGAMGSMDDSIAARGVSIASASQIARPESPYQGPSGPSFPYQMYPQNTRLSRTASVVTTSTVPIAERIYNGPRGPTHPYQMYPQNTVPEPDADPDEDRITPAPAPVPAPIPVGFPGAANNYQRRLGPEGEDVADIIGPDGHTEQLPPYTRYPDEAYARKVQGIVLPTPAAAVAAAPASIQLQAIPGAGGIGLATRNPEFASTEDLNNGAHSPVSRQSVRSFHTDTSQHDINTAALAVVNEKKPPLKKWQVAAKRKVWGVVPCWAFGLTAVIVIMLAVVLGAILGTFFGRPKRGHHSDSSSQATMTYDMTPWPTVPAGLPPLVEGTFAMPIMVTRNPATCFNDTTQAQSWNCNIVFSQLMMTIKAIVDADPTAAYSMSLSFNHSYTIDNHVYSYGMQPPLFQDARLILVNDTYEVSRGPAWAVEMPYDKVVIIPEPLFTAAASTASSDSVKHRRMGGFNGPDGGDFKRKGVAKSGERPWICHWDGTILETFIYAAQNSSHNPITTSGGGGTGTITSGSPTATLFSERPNSQWPPFSDRKQVVAATSIATDQVTATSTTASLSATLTTGGSSSSTTNWFDSPMPTDFKSAYPRVVKVEERRVSGKPSAEPWCRQYEILTNGSAQPLKDSAGNYIEVRIAEEEPAYGPSSSESRRSLVERYLGHPLEERSVGSDMSDCGCMWWST